MIVIKTDKEFEEVALQIEKLGNSLPGTPEAKELKELIKAVVAYIKSK